MSGTLDHAGGQSEGGEAVSRPWFRAVLWLAFLAPLFFLTYGYSNLLASQQSNVGSIVFDWERHIPFLAWTVVPYWSIDLFYGFSLLLCTSVRELNALGKRLITAQILAVACFIAFPLAFTFERPETSGVPGALFTALTSFDRPYNQAPSLHIALLVILWTIYARHVPKRWLWLTHVWFALVGVSVLTTYQHHFIDVPTGVLLGWTCVWIWPLEASSPLAGVRFTREPQRISLGLRYLAGSGIVAALSIVIGGNGLWLIWPALSLLFVASFYFLVGERGFQKGPDGRVSAAARWLLAPYLLGAWLNSRLWTWNRVKLAHVMDEVSIGRFPSQGDICVSGAASVIDMTAELHASGNQTAWHCFPTLDLTPPSVEVLRRAARKIEHCRSQGPVLVSCALGYSRSACAIATWLLTSGRATTADKAASIVRAAQENLVLGHAELERIAEAAGDMEH